MEDNPRVFFRADKLYFAQALESQQQYRDGGAVVRGLRPRGAETGICAKHKQLSDAERSSFYQDSAYYKIVALDANSPQSDFSPAYVDEGIVFVSARQGTSLLKPAYGWNEQAYLDLYYAPVNEIGQLGELQALNKEINSRYHEGPTAFYDGGKKNDLYPQ